MQAVAAIVETWLKQRPIGAIARVIGAEGLGPRPNGEVLLIDTSSRTGGRPSRGAVQHEVVTAARALFASSGPHLAISSGRPAAPVTAPAMSAHSAHAEPNSYVASISRQ